jgi:hypothetical protein
MSVIQWIPLARANAITASEQSDPTVVVLPDGGYAMVWMTRNGNPALEWAAQLDVMARVFNRDGSPRGPEFTVSVNPTNTDNEASITALADGNLAVVWHLSGDPTLPPETAGTEHRFRVVTQDGTEVVPVTSLGQGYGEPEITTLADGNFVTVWSNTIWLNPETPVTRVLAQEWTAAGAAVGGRIVVSEGSGSNANQFARVAPLADGGFVVVWNAELRAGWWEPSRIGLRACAYDADGTARGPVFAPIADERFSQTDGQPVGLADGGFAIAWWRGQPGTGGDIWTRSFDADGTPRGDGGIIHADPFSGGQGQPTIAALPDGGYAVAWKYDGVWLRLIDADGTPRAAETRVITERPDDFPAELNPTIAVLADGRIVVAAQGYTVGSDIWHKIVDPRGAAIAGTPGDDDILGNPLDNLVTGGDGNDRLHGLEGNDFLQGGQGNDTLETGAGNDTVWAGPGDDAVIAASGNNEVWSGLGNDTLTGGTGNDTLGAGGGDDLIDARAGGVNQLWAGAGRDTVHGADNGDQIGGAAGDDIVHAGAGADVIYLGAGNDRVYGGAGDDTLFAGPGFDRMWGGAGADRFEFYRGTGWNRVEDFEAGDTLALARGLWTGTRTAEQVVSAFGSVNAAGDAVLSFAAAGTTLIITGAGTLDGLADQIVIL